MQYFACHTIHIQDNTSVETQHLTCHT
ncbi:hypothetical protein HMPREF9714_01084, partial [Myroides odoratimimus CCUG 12901]